jgi:hypothetical protein
MGKMLEKRNFLLLPPEPLHFFLPFTIHQYNILMTFGPRDEAWMRRL